MRNDPGLRESLRLLRHAVISPPHLAGRYHLAIGDARMVPRTPYHREEGSNAWPERPPLTLLIAVLSEPP